MISNFGASSAFYIILSFVIFLLALGAETTKNRLFPIMIILVMTVVAGFRAYDVGTDTAEYVRLFNVVKDGGQIKEELGFALVSGILMRIFNNPTVLFLIYGFIIYGLIIWRIWDYRDKISVGLAIFSFYAFFFFESMNVMRQFIAIAFVFWGTKYLRERSYLKFCIFTLIAVSFHLSAILAFLYLFVEFLSWNELEKKQKRFLIGLGILALALSGFVLASFNTLYARYRHYFMVVNRNVGFRVFALMIIFFLSLLLPSMKSGKNPVLVNDDNKYFIHTTRIYYLMACGLGVFGYFYDYMARLGLYFYPFVFIYFGYIMKERNTVLCFAVKLLILLVILYILYQYIFLVNGSGHHPYHIVLEW